jgi:hypothetical protein
MEPWVQWVGIAMSAAVMALGFFIGFIIGKKKGEKLAEVSGAHCDVCQNIGTKWAFFRGQVICGDCYKKIMSNRDMKCKFCEQPIEKCECS